MISYEELTPGYEFPPASYEMTSSLISKYLKAAESSADEFVPPLAIAAYAMAAMTGALSLPPGSIHASQDFEFLKPIRIGATVNCQAKVLRKVTRGKLNILELEINVFDQSQDKVQWGKSTIMVPA